MLQLNPIQPMPVITHSLPVSRDLYQLRLALRVLTFGLGMFFLAMSYNKLAWFDDPGQLTQRFQRWLPSAAPYARVYLRTVAIPGAEVFARVVPIAEFLTALSMLTGLYTNIAAAAALVMILNFHTATSSFSSLAFLTDATGPPLFAALMALVVGGSRLPFSFDSEWQAWTLGRRSDGCEIL